jgi:hypothetical protein
MIPYRRSFNDLNQTLADVNAAQQALDAVKKDEQVARTETEGLLHKNDDVSQASGIDIFRGNLISNYLQVDFGKVQMFFFTVVVVVAYGAAVAVLLRTCADVLNPLGVGLPPFSDSLNGLLAISHGTCLTTKATAQS